MLDPEAEHQPPVNESDLAKPDTESNEVNLASSDSSPNKVSMYPNIQAMPHSLSSISPITTVPIQSSTTTNMELVPYSPSRLIKRPKLELMSLPTEMHYHINSFLDHTGLLHLSATNKYFQELFPVDKFKNSLVCFEQCSLVVGTLLTRKNLLPCYVCLKGRESRAHFPPSKDGFYELGSTNASSRVCATCLIATRPDIIKIFGVPRDNDWIFAGVSTGMARECALYLSNFDRIRGDDQYWLACPKCNTVKRHQVSPYDRRRRYNQAIIKGDMCAACYQPVWDAENKVRRQRKNARRRELRRVKKEEQRKTKEAEQSEAARIEANNALMMEMIERTLQGANMPATGQQLLQESTLAMAGSQFWQTPSMVMNGAQASQSPDVAMTREELIDAPILAMTGSESLQTPDVDMTDEGVSETPDMEMIGQVIAQDPFMGNTGHHISQPLFGYTTNQHFSQGPFRYSIGHQFSQPPSPFMTGSAFAQAPHMGNTGQHLSQTLSNYATAQQVLQDPSTNTTGQDLAKGWDESMADEKFDDTLDSLFNESDADLFFRS